MKRTDHVILDNLASGRVHVDAKKGIVYGVQGRALKPTLHNGYAAVGLRGRGGKWVKVYVHRLMWLAEHGEIPEGKTVTHTKPPDSDNRLKNLAIGRKQSRGFRPLSKAHVRRVRSYKRLTQRQIAERMGITQARVSQLRKAA